MAKFFANRSKKMRTDNTRELEAAVLEHEVSQEEELRETLALEAKLEQDTSEYEREMASRYYKTALQIMLDQQVEEGFYDCVHCEDVGCHVCDPLPFIFDSRYETYLDD